MLLGEDEEKPQNIDGCDNNSPSQGNLNSPSQGNLNSPTQKNCKKIKLAHYPCMECECVFNLKNDLDHHLTHFHSPDPIISVRSRIKSTKKYFKGYVKAERPTVLQTAAADEKSIIRVPNESAAPVAERPSVIQVPTGRATAAAERPSVIRAPNGKLAATAEVQQIVGLPSSSQQNSMPRVGSCSISDSERAAFPIEPYYFGL